MAVGHGSALCIEHSTVMIAVLTLVEERKNRCVRRVAIIKDLSLSSVGGSCLMVCGYSLVYMR